MEGRRRLILLAAIIVAVAIGAVGVTLMSLFEAGLEQQRQLLGERLTETAEAQRQDQRIATILRDNTQWRAQDGAPLSSDVERALAEAIARNPQPGEMLWQIDSNGAVLAAIRILDAQRVRMAWMPLAELREPYHRAAWQAGLGLLVLLTLGLFLFYRMTSPLLRSIAASEARYRTLFSSTAEGVLLIGERIEECNDRVCDMLHCRREDVIGMPWRDFFRRYGGADGRLPVFEGRVVEALNGRGGPFVWEFSPQHGDSSLIVEIALRRLSHQHGQAQVLASLRDVSYREEATRALRMAERTLRESRDKIAQAGRSSALIELAAGIAHEVNQPLAAIANYAQASRRLVVPGQPCPEDVAVALDRIAEQVHRAGDAIHRIRALVAVPAPGENITCVNQLVQEVAALMSEEIDAAGATVTLDLSEDMLPVLADPLQIQQVVVQLLRNALEAVHGMPADRRQIRIVSRVAGEEVEVEIIDQGGGIAADDQQRVFEPFFSTREGGMGMGLAISLSIIRSHLGELTFDPVREGGACFRFRLPADTRDADKQQDPHQEGSAAPCRDKVAP